MTPADYRATATESQIVQAVLRACKAHSAVAFVWRNNTGAALMNGKRWVSFGHAGMSDVLGCLRTTGQLLALEVKRPGAKPTPDQRAFLDAVERAGGVSAVVHSAGEALAVLDSQLKSR